MPSIIPGFEYDIFISYRQNDNRSGWVTEFVNALQDELAATLKDSVSIYFDSNPHDGLHETHDVDGSLKEKVKCLVFIPIVSQTYCDPNAFAWQKEFLPFLDFVKQDPFELDINVTGGNIIKRVLPIRIHDIDETDKKLFEDQIGGVIRPVDFIYKEAGVNRPLKPTDDKQENLNKTEFSNQINKVALAIKEIIGGIKNPKEERTVTETTKSEPSVSTSTSRKRNLVLSSIVAAVLIISIAVYFLKEPREPTSLRVEREPSIAVLAFTDQSPNKDQEWLGDGVADEIMNVLAQVKELKVSGKTSTFSFKGKDATIKEIGKQLDVATVLEGSVVKLGDQIRITAQLIDVATEAHLWSNKYDSNSDDIFAIVDEVSQSIAGALINELSGDRLLGIQMVYKPKPEAYESFLRAEFFHQRYIRSRDPNVFPLSHDQYLRAIDQDSVFADAYAGLANLYDTKGNFFNTRAVDHPKRDSILSIAYRVNPEAPYVLYLKGYVETRNNMDSAIYFLGEAYRIDPYNKGSTLLMNALANLGFWDLCLELSEKYLQRDPLDESMLYYKAQSLRFTPRASEAIAVFENLLTLDSINLLAIQNLINIHILVTKDEQKYRKLIDREQQIAPDTSLLRLREAMVLYSEGKPQEAIALDSRIELGLAADKNNTIHAIQNVIDNSRTKYVANMSYMALQYYVGYEPLRDEPVFQEWLNEAKVVHEERVSKYYQLFQE